MRGFLSYLILWDLSKRKMTGAEIANEIEKRKGTRPSPGTIYPALKDLKEKRFIKADKDKSYSLTKKGEKEIKSACDSFMKMFYDMKDMCKCRR